MRIGIAGLGLIGGSLGAALRRAGHLVVGHDIAPGRRQRALDLGLVDAVMPVGDMAAAGDVVILATPLHHIAALLPIVDAASPAETVIMDTGSAKEAVVTAMEALPGAARMVGGHPLAGSERSGPDAADRLLFQGRPFVLTPTYATSPVALATVQALASQVGARPLLMDPVEHDRIVAGTSHLPQILSSLLARCVPPHPDLAGPGYRDMTRLAASDPVLWRDVLLANAPQIAAVGRRYRDELDALLAAIDRGDPADIERLLGAKAAEVLP